MIVVDTSALMSILNNEPTAAACRNALRSAGPIMMSAATLTEAKIVAAGRGLADSMDELLRRSISDVISLTPARAERAADAYTRWGKGFHRAALNYGDCFAYAAAREFDCPLLYIGNDFIHTDITAAISAPHP